MRLIKQLLTAVVMLGLTLGVTAPVSAQASEQQVVYLTSIKKGTNYACPKGTDKAFIVELRVPKGERIRTFGSFTLTLKSGKELTDLGYQVNRRLVEYYYFPKSRYARVNRDKALSYAYVELSEGATATARVRKQCMQRVP